jgi:hypothetical protein
VHWRYWHLVVGGLGLLLFVLTGQYMARVVGVPELDDTQRLMYRSLHLYLMGACAANALTGHYMRAEESLGFFRGAASLVLLISPFLLAVSFFTEAGPGMMERGLARYGLFLLFGAGAAAVVAELWQKFRPG